jgi:hypothetical protein
MSESIFENGYLKSEFINPEYRGNWSIELWNSCKKMTDGRLLAADNGDYYITPDYCFSPKIKQFTPQDIPVGELVYYKICEEQDWKFLRYKPAIRAFSILDGCYVVPYIIAKTAEDAERLKDWSK